MKKAGLLLSLSTLLLSMVTAAEFSRADFIQYAFENSESILQLQEEQKKTTSMRKEYNAKAFPQINGQINYQVAPKSYNPYDFGTFPSVSGMMDQTNQSAEGIANDMAIAGMLDGLFSNLDLSPKKQTLQWKIDAAQPIFAQGKVTTGIRIAELYQEMLITQIEEAKFSLAEQVTIAYDLALLAQLNIETRKEALTTSEASHLLAVRLFETGKGNQLDTLTSSYEMQSERFSLRSAEQNYSLAVENLLTTVSMEKSSSDITLTDKLIDNKINEEYHQCIEKMLASNPNLAIMDKAEKIQEKQTKLVKADYLPTVVAGASAGQITQFDNADEIDFGWDVKLFASVQVPIWHGGQRGHKLDQARTDERKLSMKRDEAENMLTLALSASWQEYTLAIEDITQVEKMRELATKAVAIAELAYEVGQSTQLELNKAKQNLSMTNLAYNNALFKKSKAVASIKKLMGDTSLLSL